MSELADSPIRESRSPLRDNWVAIVFMVALLFISGVTASVVGYKIKTADRQRKADLLGAYTQLGGSFESSLSPGQTALRPSMNEQQKVFVATYELNERARKIGLYRVLETTPAENLDIAQEGMMSMDAKEGGLTLKDSLVAFRDMPTNSKSLNPTAERFARQYDRYLARDTEAKLYKYLVDNRAAIEKRS